MNSARPVWSARTPQGRVTRGIARAGRIQKPGHGQVIAPAVPAPLAFGPQPTGSARRLADGPADAAARVCFIQPPSSLPTPATIRLACSY